MPSSHIWTSLYVIKRHDGADSDCVVEIGYEREFLRNGVLGVRLCTVVIEKIKMGRG